MKHYSKVKKIVPFLLILSMVISPFLNLNIKSEAIVSAATIDDITKGDLDEDGEVTALDLAQLKMSLLGLKTLTGDAAIAADFNLDGSVNALDFVSLKSYLLNA